ncbi:hypothetical protein TNCV_3076861 [Trichonephila clavipes]|nr:hypothetical protein TNCV_3076861 [Trichonephila clavipes]
MAVMIRYLVHWATAALGSNLAEGTDVCKCIVPSRQGGSLNSRRSASPLVRLVEGEERWCSLSKLGWKNGAKSTVACMELKAKGNGRLSNLVLSRDEFRGP